MSEEKIKTFTFPCDNEMDMKSALGFFECYRSPKEVEELKALLDSMNESSKATCTKNLMPLILIADMFGAPKCLMDKEQNKEE